MQYLNVEIVAGSEQIYQKSYAPCTPTSGCQMSFALPPGQYQIGLEASDAPFGAVLAQAAVQVTVTPGTTSTVRATLDGVVQSISVGLASPLLLSGSPQSTQLVVTGYDFDGDVVIAPGNYTKPIVISTTTTNTLAPANALTVSSTTLNGPSDKITVSFDGRSYTSLLLTANYPDISGMTVPYHIAPQLAATEYAIPSGAQTSSSIIEGPDGNVWAATHLSLVRITHAGQMAEYCTNPGPSSLLAGPNGQIWFGSNVSYAPAPGVSSCAVSSLGLREMTTSGAQTTLLAPANIQRTYGTTGPLAAPDGTIWAYDTSDDMLEQVNASGTVTQSFQAYLGGSAFSGFQTPQIASDGAFWFTFPPSVVRCTIAGGCAALPSLDPSFLPQMISPGPNGTLLLQDAEDIWDVNASNVVQWHTNHSLNPWYASLDGPATYFKNATWVSASVAPDNHAQLLHIEPDGKNFAYIEFPLANGDAGMAPSAGGFLLGSDGRLWYTRGSSIGVASIP